VAVDYWQYFVANLPRLLDGLGTTFLLTFVAIVAGFIFGILLALGRVYGNRVVNAFCIGYIEVIRGTPLLVQLFIIYFGFPTFGVLFSPLQAALVGLSINSAAYQAEYLRGSIQAVEGGQMLAARSLGMSKWQAVRNVVLPQSLRIAIPAWSNEFIYLLQYSSAAYIIQVAELTYEGKIIAANSFQYLETFVIIAIIYIVLTLISSEVFDRIEKRFSIPGIGASFKSRA
jgi:polar amino acid transport system permease protein